MRSLRTSRLSRVAVAAAALVLITGGAAVAADGPNLVANGNFASPNVTGTQVINTLPGWTLLDGEAELDGPDIFAVPTGSVAGTQVVDLNTASRTSVQQAIQTVAGRTYTLTYNLAGHPGNGTPGAARIVTGNVLVDGAMAESINFDTAGHSRTDPGWVARTYTFTAAGASTVITFQSTIAGSRGPLITNVAAHEVLPDGAPLADSSIALMLLTSAAAFAVVVVVRRRSASTAS